MRRALTVALSTALGAAGLLAGPVAPAAALALADVAVTVSGTPAVVAPGQAVTYRVTVTNKGSLGAVNVSVTDSQSGGSIEAAQLPAGCAGGGSTATCSVASLAGGASRAFDLRVNAPNAPGTITNTARVTAVVVPTMLDQVPGNNQASASTAVGVADVGITDAALAPLVGVGQPATFRVTVTNVGSLAVTKVTVNSTQTGGTFDASRPATGCTYGSTTASCTTGALAAGASKTFDLAVKAPLTVGVITNSVTASPTFSPAATDSNAANNSASAASTVNNPDLAAAAQSLVPTASFGQDVIYRVTASNPGSVAATGVSLSSSLSAGTFDASRPTAGCTATATVATCTVGSLAPGQSLSFDLFAVAPSAVGNITNTASVAGTFASGGSDASAANNTATAATPITDPGVSAGGFIPPTGHLGFGVNDLGVPADGTNGVIAKLAKPAVAAGTMCGANPCNKDIGLHVGFVDDAKYRVVDVNHPIVVDVTFGNGDPCRGLGNDCTLVYWRKSASMTPAKMAFCPGVANNGIHAGPGVADPAPCLNEKYKTSNGDIHYRVLMLSNDPDLLAPLRSVLVLK